MVWFDSACKLVCPVSLAFPAHETCYSALSNPSMLPAPAVASNLIFHYVDAQCLLRLITPSPNSAEPNNQAAAGIGTADTVRLNVQLGSPQLVEKL